MLRAILKYRHGSLPQSKLSRELAKQAVTTKCRGKYQCGAKPCLLKKAVDFRAKIKSVIISKKNFICGNLWIKNSVDKKINQWIRK